MTDTPRTQAELLASFASGLSIGIPAQTMRDFVVSLPFAPSAPDRLTLTKSSPPGQSVPASDYNWRAIFDTVQVAQLGTSFAYDLDVSGHTEVSILEDGMYQLSVVANFPDLTGGKAWAQGVGLDPGVDEAGNLVFSGLTPPPSGEVVSPACTFTWWIPAGTTFTAQFVQDSASPVTLTYAQMSAIRLA